MYAGTNKGGTEAIVAAERLAFERRAQIPAELTVDTVLQSFPHAIDRIMGEGGLWAPEIAARAYLQANGDTTEAVHLIRAHRATLPRFQLTEPLNPREVELLRRVVSTQRQPDGPMILGETVDYTARIIHDGDGPALPVIENLDDTPIEHPADEPFRRFRDWMHDAGLLVDRTLETDEEPFDIQLVAAELPATRSAWLSAIAQSDTGGLINIWYQSILGTDGYATEDVTLGEVRHGRIPVRVMHPHLKEPVSIGRIRVSECEAVADMGAIRGEDPTTFDIGYAMALGHNERKAIAGATLEVAAYRFREQPEGLRLQQILMHTTDGLAANGFLEHLKLPHYVTFQSKVDAVLAIRQEEATELMRLLEDAAEGSTTKEDSFA